MLLQSFLKTGDKKTGKVDKQLSSLGEKEVKIFFGAEKLFILELRGAS